MNVVSGNLTVSGEASIGVAAAVPIINKTTMAYIGPYAIVTTSGDQAGVTVNNGTFNPPNANPAYESNTSADANFTAFSSHFNASPNTDSGFSGVAVTATNIDEIATAGVSGGVSGAVAINLGGAVNVMTNNTDAYIGANAQVTAGTPGDGSNQSVLGGLRRVLPPTGDRRRGSVPGEVAASPGIDVRVVTNTTKAYIDGSATVSASKDVIVAATASEAILSIVFGVAASGEVAIGGSMTVTEVNDTTWADLGTSSSVTAGGNVLVSAEDTTNVSAVAGSLGVGIGTAGIGALISLVDLARDTEAFVAQGASVTAGADNTENLASNYNIYAPAGSSGFKTLSSFQGLAVQAASSESIFNLGIAGAGGLFVGIAGGITAEIIGSNTSAYIGQNAKVNESQGVNVAAVNSATDTSTGGAPVGRHRRDRWRRGPRLPRDTPRPTSGPGQTSPPRAMLTSMPSRRRTSPRRA